MGGYRHGRRLYEEDDQGKIRRPQFQHHGSLAALLLAVGMVTGVGVPALVRLQEIEGNWVFLLIAMAGVISWIWGCFHLAIHFRLNPLWGCFGLLFLLGFVVIYWASRQKPNWDRERAKRRIGEGRTARPRDGSDSIY